MLIFIQDIYAHLVVFMFCEFAEMMKLRLYQYQQIKRLHIYFLCLLDRILCKCVSRLLANIKHKLLILCSASVE